MGKKKKGGTGKKVVNAEKIARTQEHKKANVARNERRIERNKARG